MGRMANWPSKHKIVGDVRGKGLMIGVEIIRDQKSKERAHDFRESIVDRAFEKGSYCWAREKIDPYRAAIDD